MTNGSGQLALAYAEAGLSVIPIEPDGSKAPAKYLGSWLPFQSRIAWGNELSHNFRGAGVGIGVIGGEVSDGLEILDFDEPGLSDDFTAEVESLRPGLMDRLTTIETPNGGRHIAYRCDTIEGNQKLAMRPETKDGRTVPKVRIETRGRGGYVVAPGSPAACHPTGRQYLHLSGPSYTEGVNRITPDERNQLLRVARSFNLWVEPETNGHQKANGQRIADGLSPGDDYNQRTSWEEILEPQGWAKTHSRGEITYWRRPGKECGWSATTGVKSQAGAELFCCFTDNAYPFEGAKLPRICTSYSKFAAFALLNHGGDYSAAAKALAAQGYGEQRPRADAGQHMNGHTDLVAQSTDSGLSDRVRKLLEKPGKLADRWRGNREGLKDQSPAGIMQAIACGLVRACVPTPEIVAAVSYWGAQSGHESAANRIGSIIENAYQMATTNGQQTAEPASVQLERLTSRELDESIDEQKYIVQDILPDRQGGLISGRFKTLKTSIGVDLAYSIATGTKFLNRFNVLMPTRCGIISAESGKPTLRDIGRRVALARGMKLSDAESLVWSTSRVDMTHPLGIEALERFIVEDELGVLLCDPTYLMMAGIGDAAANVFKMATALEPLSRLTERTGCTLILCNHNRKNRALHQKQDDPPELAEIAMSGFCEWSRFWLLLGPRKDWDDATGTHWLWMRTGGSAGHAGLWAITAIEGKRSDPGGRRWDVAVENVSDVREADEHEREVKRAHDRERVEDEHRAELLAELRRHPNGETKSQLRSLTGLNERNFGKAMSKLLQEGRAEDCDITKQGQTREGYKPQNPIPVNTGQPQSFDRLTAGQSQIPVNPPM